MRSISNAEPYSKKELCLCLCPDCAYDTPSGCVLAVRAVCKPMLFEKGAVPGSRDEPLEAGLYRIDISTLELQDARGEGAVL